ncbi:MAG: saccharopine dehydrogenase C-terminal domain-containing protein [Thermoplasmatales archaeon]|nr:saccharopine dehydrogenase C-terminal domain-containing protein [Thermoplasmatales archaeon]
MKKVLVLGAGLVAKPLVRYLLDSDYNVKVASRTLSKAEFLTENHPNGYAEQLNVDDKSRLRKLIGEADIVISLLPYTHHVTVADICIQKKKDMVTTSYVSDKMQGLNEKAVKAGIIILNETGLDPGIDHMSAMKIIHRVKNSGGKITSFCSYCGGLPAPEANTNPFGYKFSWSPRGVVLAAKNNAKYLKNGKEVFVPSEKLFDAYSIISIPEIGDFEAYPNRNSIPYIDKYGINGTETMFRGTLRNLGWCETWKKIGELGLLNEKTMDLTGLSFREFTEKLINKKDVNKKGVAEYLKIDENSDVIKRFEWLGLLGDEKLPVIQGSPLDVLVAQLLKNLQYKEGERDMVVLHHEFIAEFKKGKEKINSTLIDFGIPNGDSSMARTVGLPAAIATKLILEEKIDSKGVHIPILPAIYEPILKELGKLGVKFKEKTEET